MSGIVGAIEAVLGRGRHGPGLILSIVNDGARVTLYDQPVLGWLTPLPPPAAPIPIVVDSLPASAQWALVEIAPHGQPAELAGAPRVTVDVPGAWRGSFVDFLDWIESTTGLPVIGTSLQHGALIHRFGDWLGSKYGGRSF